MTQKLIVLVVDDAPDNAGIHAKSGRQAVLGELAFRHERLGLSATLGSLHENDSFLGARNFDSRTLADTLFSSVSASYDLGDGYATMASYSQGLSRGTADGQAATYVATTQAFSLGLMKQKFITDNDRLAMSLTLPARVSKGDVTLNAAVDVDMKTGAPIMGLVPVSLAPEGRERRLELSWSTPLRAGDLALTAMRRLQPNHDETAPPENLVGVRFNRAF